jgi:hypothetical protein
MEYDFQEYYEDGKEFGIKIRCKFLNHLLFLKEQRFLLMQKDEQDELKGCSKFPKQEICSLRGLEESSD